MAILIFEHHPADASCRLGETLRDFGHRLRVVRLHGGDSVPPDLDDVDGLVVMGGPMNLEQVGQYPWLDQEMAFIRLAHETGLSVVGVCLGAQLIGQALGGQVGAMDQAEIGFGPVALSFAGRSDPIYAGIPWTTHQFHAHSQQVAELPEGATALATSPTCPHQAFKVGLTTYAFQYHFEWNRADVGRFLREQREWILGNGVQPEQVPAGLDKHYAMYRHLGDRICRTLAELVFPLDKRLDHQIGPIQNYHASYF